MCTGGGGATGNPLDCRVKDPRLAVLVVAALGQGATLRTADAVRLGPSGDATDATVGQLCEVAGRLVQAGPGYPTWRPA